MKLFNNAKLYSGIAIDELLLTSLGASNISAILINGTTGRRTFDCHWESMNCRVGTKNLVFCSGNNAPTLFPISTKDTFNVH